MKNPITISICLILNSCALTDYNYVDSLKDNNVGYLNRNNYINTASSIIREKHPKSSDLLTSAPMVSRQKYWIDRIINGEVTVSWEKDIPKLRGPINPISFRRASVIMQRDGSVKSHNSGIGKGYVTCYSTPNLTKQNAEQGVADDR